MCKSARGHEEHRCLWTLLFRRVAILYFICTVCCIWLASLAIMLMCDWLASIKVTCSIWNARQSRWQMSLEALHLHGVTTAFNLQHSRSQSPHIENFNKRLSFGIYIIYNLRAVTSEVHIVFQALKLQPRDWINSSSRCSSDRVLLWHIYLLLSMFNAQYCSLSF